MAEILFNDEFPAPHHDSPASKEYRPANTASLTQFKTCQNLQLEAYALLRHEEAQERLTCCSILDNKIIYANHILQGTTNVEIIYFPISRPIN